MPRWLRWVAGVAWGAMATLFVSFGPPLGFGVMLLGVALLMPDRIVAISGPLVGFGIAWLWWISRPSMEAAALPAILFGVVPLGIGAAVIVPSLARTLRRHALGPR